MKKSDKKVSGKKLAGKKFRLIPTKPILNPEPPDLPVKYTIKQWKDLVAEAYDPPKAIIPYLTLSAAKLLDSGKGWIEAVGCRTIFPTNPVIDFQTTNFNGKISLWLDNLNVGDSFTVQFRVVCGLQGEWRISSSETPHIDTPIIPVFQSIDFFIPPVDSDSTMMLVELEPTFTDDYGFWSFKDVIVNKVDF